MERTEATHDCLVLFVVCAIGNDVMIAGKMFSLPI